MADVVSTQEISSRGRQEGAQCGCTEGGDGSGEDSEARSVDSVWKRETGRRAVWMDARGWKREDREVCSVDAAGRNSSETAQAQTRSP